MATYTLEFEKPIVELERQIDELRSEMITKFFPASDRA